MMNKASLLMASTEHNTAWRLSPTRHLAKVTYSWDADVILESLQQALPRMGLSIKPLAEFSALTAELSLSLFSAVFRAFVYLVLMQSRLLPSCPSSFSLPFGAVCTCFWIELCQNMIRIQPRKLRFLCLRYNEVETPPDLTAKAHYLLALPTSTALLALPVDFVKSQGAPSLPNPSPAPACSSMNDSASCFGFTSSPPPPPPPPPPPSLKPNTL